LTDARNAADAELQKLRGVSASAERAAADAALIRSALSERRAVESKLGGWFGFIGKPYGSTDTWSTAEYEFATMRLEYEGGKITSPTRREQVEAVIREQWSDAQEAIARWARENMVKVAAIAETRFTSAHGASFVGCTIYRIVETLDGRIHKTIADDAAKPLRLWHANMNVRDVLKSNGVRVMAGAELPEVAWRMNASGNVQRIEGERVAMLV
jgi:hypothetical protein